jgi:hypothetical protein
MLEKMMSKASMNSRLLALGAVVVGVSLAGGQRASGALIESFENSYDGWGVIPSYNPQSFVSSFSSTTGVTDGSYSLAITGTGTSGPNYGQMLYSPSSAALTALLANASSISIDFYAPSGSFGYYLQVQVGLNGGATGYVALNGYDGIGMGSEYTLTVPISSAVSAQLAGSSAAENIFIQVGGGFSAGNETFYIDNIQANLVPEPASFGLLAAGGGLAMLRRRV